MSTTRDLMAAWRTDGGRGGLLGVTRGWHFCVDEEPGRHRGHELPPHPRERAGRQPVASVRLTGGPGSVGQHHPRDFPIWNRSPRNGPLIPQGSAGRPDSGVRAYVREDGGEHTTRGAKQMSEWGRVSDDGTVYVKTAEGERAVGSWHAGTPEQGLAHFVELFRDRSRGAR